MTDRLLQPMERKLKDYAVLALKGMGMGAADVVPGVSGAVSYTHLTLPTT